MNISGDATIGGSLIVYGAIFLGGPNGVSQSYCIIGNGGCPPGYKDAKIYIAGQFPLCCN